MVYMVVLTGGPCSGKTTALDEIAKEFGEKVAPCPETATILFGGGYPRAGKDVDFSPQWAQGIQQSIITVQTNMEQAFIDLAKKRRASMVLLDRGLLDNAAYMEGGLNDLIQITGKSLDDLYGRYHIVIQLESLAVTSPALYEKYRASNPARTETVEEARTLDRLICDAWKDHPNYHVVTSNLSMKDKIAQVTNLLSDVLFKEIERKWKLKRLPHDLLSWPDQMRIVQGYISASDGNELRLRKTEGVDGTCWIASKLGNGVSRSEWEKTIPEDHFQAHWPLTAGRRVAKTRYISHHDNFKLELDVFSGTHDGLWILEVEVESEKDFDTFELPNWAHDAVEVTDNPQYKNKWLAQYGMPKS